MIVAVAARFPSSSVAPSFPPQQSPVFGQRASSHTVCRPSPRKSFLILAKEEPVGIVVLRKDGSRGLLSAERSFSFHRHEYIGLITHPFVFPNTTRSGAPSDMKSSREGPEAKVSEKPVLEDEDEGVAKVRM